MSFNLCSAWQVVLLDERGKEMTSEKFADLIADAGETVGGLCLSSKFIQILLAKLFESACRSCPAS